MDDIERARSLADRYWDGLLQLEPMICTLVGDDRYDDRLSDPSEAGRVAAEELNRSALDELAAIDRPALDPTMRGTLDVLEACARRWLADLEHRTDRLAPAAHFWGPVTALAEIASMQAVDTPEQLDRYERRLRSFPAFLDSWADVAREGIAAGVTSPRVVAERASGQLDRLLALDPADSPAAVPLGDRAAER